MRKILVNLFDDEKFGPDELNPNLKPTDMKKIAWIPAGTPCNTVDLKDLQNSGRLSYHKFSFNDKIVSTSIEDYLKTGSTIKDIKEYFLGIQVFNCGYRWSNECDYDSWSGLICIDVDSKKYTKPFDFEELNNKLFSKLKSDKKTGSRFYCMQRSASGNSLHVFFYFNWKTLEGDFSVEELFKFLATKYIDVVKDAMAAIGYADIANTKDVLDDCSKKPAQPIYLSPYEIKFNDFDFYGDTFGDMTGMNVDLIKAEKSIDFEVKIKFDNNEKLSFRTFPKTIKSWAHPTRFALYKIFARYFGDDIEEAENWYSKIVCFIRDEYNKANGGKVYDEKTLIRQFRSNYKNILTKIKKDEQKENLDGKYSPYTSVSSKMLHFFEECFNVKAHREGVDEITEYIFNNEIQLVENQKNNEYISDYMFDIKTHVLAGENVYIQADCGTGKSYFFKNLLDDANLDKVIIICHLNSIKDSVYAAEITNPDVVIPTSVEIRKFCKNGNLPNKMLIGWPQLAELYKFSDKIDLSDYVKCFDEIHNIVTTMSYRHSAIYDIVRWKELQKRCICVSATSCGENYIFCQDSIKYSFKKDLRYKLKTYLYTPRLGKDESGKINILPEINRVISEYGYRGGYDKIVVFDNVRHQEIYHKWRTEALHYCKDLRTNENVIELQKTNNLKHKLFVTTTYGTEGIEIKNDIDKVLFIIPLRSGVTYTVVTQILNRFRKMKHADVIFMGTGYNNMVYFDEDGPVMSIVNEIKQNNPDFLEWKEKENYYLSSWMYWKNTDLDNEKLDLFPKLVMLYHNYMLNQTITEYNIHGFYPNIRYNDFPSILDDTKEIKDHLYLIGKYPNLAFTRATSKNALDLLNNYLNVDINPKNAGGEDIFDLGEINMAPIFSDCIKDPALHGKLIRTMVLIQNMFTKVAEGFDLDHYFRILENDAFAAERQDCDLTKYNEYNFIIKMVRLFRTKDLRFKPSSFKRFFIGREKMKSKPITQKQAEKHAEDTKTYIDFIEKYNLHDDLLLNVCDSLWDQIKDIEIKDEPKTKTWAKGDRVGKAINKTYTLIDNPFIEFHTHEDCWKYATDNFMTKVSFGSWVKKGVWKKFFIKN